MNHHFLVDTFLLKKKSIIKKHCCSIAFTQCLQWLVRARLSLFYVQAFQLQAAVLETDVHPTLLITFLPTYSIFLKHYYCLRQLEKVCLQRPKICFNSLIRFPGIKTILRCIEVFCILRT